MKQYFVLMIISIFAMPNLNAQQSYFWKYWYNTNNYATLGQGQYENKLFSVSDSIGQTWTGYQVNEVKYVVKSSSDSVYNAQYFSSTGDIVWNDGYDIYKWNGKNIKAFTNLMFYLTKSTDEYDSGSYFSDYLITEQENGNVLVNFSLTGFLQQTGIFFTDEYVSILNDTVNINNDFAFSSGRSTIIRPGILADKNNYWVNMRGEKICELNNSDTIQCLQLPEHNQCSKCESPRMYEIPMALDNNGNIWLSTTIAYLDEYDGTKWQSFVLQDDTTIINSIAVDSKNNILLATSSGLIYFNHNNFIYNYPDGSYFTKANLTYVSIANDGSIGVVNDSGNVADFSWPKAIDTTVTNSVFLVYPNPFKSEVIFSLPTSFKSGGTLEIFNVTGQKVYSTNVNSSGNTQLQINMDASVFSSGVYFCRAIDGSKVFMNKMVKQ